jgi:TonB family protein
VSNKTLKRAALAVLISVAVHTAIVLAFVGKIRQYPVHSKPVELNVSFLEFSTAGKTVSSVSGNNVSALPKIAIPHAVPASAPSPEIKWPAAVPPVAAPPVSDVSPPLEKPRFRTPETGEAASERAGVRVDAKMLNSIVPVYPRVSRMRGEEGKVLLEVLVDRSGTVVEVQIRASSGYPRLDKAAVAALENARFDPALSDGTPVESRVLLPFVFKLDQ